MKRLPCLVAAAVVLFGCQQSSPSKPAVSNGWNKPLSAVDTARMIDEVKASLTSRHLHFSIDESTGQWTVTERPHLSFGLTNLAQTYGQVSPSDRPAMIKDYLDTLLAPPPVMPDNFADAKDHLRIRLIERNQAIGPLAKKDLTDDLTAYLMIDNPKTAMSVSSAQALKWGKSLDELLQLASKNAYAHIHCEARGGKMPNVGQYVAVQGDDFFVSSLGYDPETTLKWLQPKIPHSPAGYLVAVPTRNVCIIATFFAGKAALVVKAIEPMVKGLYDAGPGSASPSIYWVQAGAWRRVEVDGSGKVKGPAALLK